MDAVPALSTDTEAILKELGFAGEELPGLRATGAIVWEASSHDS